MKKTKQGTGKGKFISKPAPTSELIAVLQDMMKIKNKLEHQSYSNLEKKSRALRKELERLEEYDLLLTLYNWIIDTAYEDKSEIDKTVLENFVSVSNKAEIKQEHNHQISDARVLIDEAENGKPNRALLFESYKQLAKLLVRHNSLKLKHQALITILRICPFLENRNKFVDPYLDFLRHNLDDIISSFPEDSHILYYTLAVFSKGGSIFNRIANIDNAIEKASHHLIPDKESFYRIVKSELFCDDGDLRNALKELDVVEHIIQTNQLFSKQLRSIESLATITRFLISFYLELQNIKIEKVSYKKQLNKFERSSSHWIDFKARKNELKALILIREEKFNQADELIKDAFILREKDIHPQLSQINLLLLELLKEDPQMFWINERIDELEKSGELFYSSVWAGILRGITEIMKNRN